MVLALLPPQVALAFVSPAPTDGSLPVLINDGEPIEATAGEILRVVAKELPLIQGSNNIMTVFDGTARFHHEHYYVISEKGSVLYTAPFASSRFVDTQIVTFIPDEWGTAVFYIAVHHDTPIGATFYLEFDSGSSFLTADVTVTEQAEHGNNSEPTIQILTPFPSGSVTVSYLDIEYIAVPSERAAITEVFYTINDGPRQFIYLSGAGGVTPMGILGEARVFITPRPENHFVFTVRDSGGREASYEVDARPTFNTMVMYPPAFNPDMLLSYGEHGEYIIRNWLNIWTALPSLNIGKDLSPERVAEAITVIDGVIIGMIPMTGSYVIQIPPVSSYEELIEVGERLLIAYPDVFKNFVPSFVGNEATPDIVGPTNDPWWTERFRLGRFRSVDAQWGIDAIGATAAWERFGNPEIEVKVGIIDFGGIRHTHEDLDIPCENVINFYQHISMNHGTEVMSVIGAIHDNELGLAGVANFSRNALFAYDIVQGGSNSDFYIQAGLFWNVVHGARVVNLSAGGNEVRSSSRAEILSAQMENLLNIGYDFIVVQAAGNHRNHSWETRVFSHRSRLNHGAPQSPRTPLNPVDARLLNRTITVGATDRNGRIWDDASWHLWGHSDGSAWGWFVDVVAPGDEIYVATATGDSEYRMDSGTSFAAPHVSAVAASIWHVNPGLSGEQVKEIIVESAREASYGIADRRDGRNRTYYQVNAYRAIVMAQNHENPVFTNGRAVGFVTQALSDADIEQGIYLGNPIEDAIVRLYTYGTSNLVRTTSTGSHEQMRGHFVLYNISPGRYYLTITADGFVTETTQPFLINAGVTASKHTLMIPEGPGDVGGYVLADFGVMFSDGLDALNYTEAPERIPILETVTLEVRRLGLNVNDLSGEIIKTIMSDSGRYEMTLPAGFYTVTASAEGFIETTGVIVSFGGERLLTQDIVLQRDPDFDCDFDMIIRNEADLLYMTSAIANGRMINGVPAASARYRLAANLDMSNHDTFLGIGTREFPFAGEFYGGGHSIRLDINRRYPNLSRLAADNHSAEVRDTCIDSITVRIKRPEGLERSGFSENFHQLGLFRIAEGAIIRDVTVEGNVRGWESVGGIVGYAMNTTISNVQNNAMLMLSIPGWSDDVYNFGGIAGLIIDSTIIDSINKGDLDLIPWILSEGVGGIAGVTFGSEIIGNISLGDITGYMCVGGVVGIAFDSIITDNEIWGYVRGEYAISDIVGWALNTVIERNIVHREILIAN